jgi:hypothetical protein
MRIFKPPQDLSIRIPGETMESLKQYQQYQKELGAKWELKELGAAIIDAFLGGSDADFLAWQKQGRTPKRPAVPVEPNGETHA